ncbi:MAG: hypothetical protein LQ341_003202 [Variospora aurantia]|nr:MAG: hypothetical protein LQ341_003202 [Variospora aurantia]
MSPWIETIMTGHVRLQDAASILRGHQSTIMRLTSNGPGAELGVSIEGNAAIMLSQFAHRWQTFSTTFCMEQDVVNHELRTLIENYALALDWDVQTISTWSLIIVPPLHFARIVNVLPRSVLGPGTAVYSLQVRANFIYQTKHFLAEASAALDRIDAVRRHDLKVQVETLRVLLAEIARYRDDLKISIKQCPYRGWLPTRE